MESKEATALFIGNRDCCHVSRTAIEKAITKAIESGIKVFLNGGQGYFDKTCASVLYQLKKVYPQVKSYLVIPYQEFNDYNKDLYDEIIFPFKEQSQTYYFYKRAIPYRNKYMVEHAAAAICYVRRSGGGAGKTLEYAKAKGLLIIDVES